jgi:Fe-S-cluster containining protein
MKIQKRKFSCIQGCSDCCVFREYYPSSKFGKIGVFLLPEELSNLQDQALSKGIAVKIVPRIAVGKISPERIVAFQMMGKNEDGDLCPFLDVESGQRSPHGGFACKIYENRPLACRAYPLIDQSKDASLDQHCRFCKEFSTATAESESLRRESRALDKIKKETAVKDGSLRIWRYATATGKSEDKGKMLPEGWVIDG